MAEGASKKMKIRTVIFCGGMLLILGWVLYNLVYRSLITGPDLRAKAADQQLRDTTITANRGTIYDCNMNVLAQSATVWDVILAPREVYTAISRLETQADKDAYEQKLIDGLCSILEVDEETVRGHLSHTESMYREVKRKVVKSVADEITQYVADNGLTGVYLQVNTKRFYPYDDLASSVTGSAIHDNQGVYASRPSTTASFPAPPGGRFPRKMPWARLFPLPMSSCTPPPTATP